MDVWWKRSMLLTYNRNQLNAVQLLYTLLLVCCGYPTWVLVNSVSATPMTRIASEYDHTSCLSALWNTPRKSIPPFSLLYHHSDSNFEWHAADLILIHSTSEEVLQQEDSIVHKFEIPPQHPTPVSIICSEICYRLVLDNRWKSTDLLTGISHNVCFCIDRNVHIIKLKPQNSIQKLADAVGSQLESEIDIYEVVTECPLDISDCGTSYMSSAITTEEWRRGPTLHSPSSNACQVVPWTKTGQLCCIPSHMIDNVGLVIQHTQNKNRSLMNTILIHSIIVILIFCFGELLLYFYLRNRNIWGTQIALAHASSEAMLTAEDIAAADNVGEHLVELLPRRGQSLFESCDDSVCPICLALLVEQECLRFPACGHTLHSECAKSLISHGARRLQDIVCPLCRVTVATLVSREETELPSEASPVNGAESAISAVSNQEETQEGGTSYLNVAEETQEHDTERNNETCELVSSDPRTTDPQPTNEDENEVKDAKEQNSEALA